MIENLLKEEKEKSNKDKAKKQLNLNSELEGESIKLVYENLNEVNIKCYKVDLEIYYSLNPFKKQSVSDYNMVVPFYTESVVLKKSEKS